MKKTSILLLYFFLLSGLTCRAFDWGKFDLDSIAQMGRFPRFCVDTYRWGDKFFNGYDEQYVTGTGYKFNVKLRTDSWFDTYGFRFGNGTDLELRSQPSTSAGFYLTYLAVSVGYDMNVSKYLGINNDGRHRWNFQFNCMLFNVGLYWVTNDGNTRITRMTTKNEKLRPDLAFNNVKTSEWGIDLNYFFNHKRYSRAAAFSFGREQIKSGGSFSGGFSFWRQQNHFDFDGLPQHLLQHIPLLSQGYRFEVDTHNYFINIGYGYNWVFAPHWTMGVSETLMPGLSAGYISDGNGRATRTAVLNDTRLSLVWNNNHWFCGIVGTGRLCMVGNTRRTTLDTLFNIEASLGYRFNLW